MFLGRFPTFRNKKNRVGTSASRPAPTLQQQKLPIAVVVFAQIPASGCFLHKIIGATPRRAHHPAAQTENPGSSGNCRGVRR